MTVTSLYICISYIYTYPYNFYGLSSLHAYCMSISFDTCFMSLAYLLSILLLYSCFYTLHILFMFPILSCSFPFMFIYLCMYHILSYLVYFHITYLILSCAFIYILILFIYGTFVCFNLVFFMYYTFICLLLVSSLSSFISMTYYILCTIITYIIYYPIPISSLLSCSGYTPMLCYSFLTYCFIIYFLIRTCIVIYFHFILYCHIVLSYIFILYFSYIIISYDFHILYFHIICHVHFCVIDTLFRVLVYLS